jgi:YD repeat-containing protein
MSRFRSILLPLLAAALWSAPSQAQAPPAPDTDPPQIQLRESGAPLADGALFNRAVTPVIAVTDASPVTVTATLDGAAFASGTAVAAPGTHQLAVTAQDEADNEATIAIGFEIDTAPPVFGVIQPAAGTVTASLQVTLQGKVTGAASVTVDEQPAALTGEDWTAGPFTLAQGQKSWTLKALDAAGNQAQKTHSIVVDSQAPALSVSQPAAGVVLKDPAVDVVGSVSDPHLGAVTVNGTAAAVTGTSWLARQVPLAEGDNTLTARAEDQAGNAAQVTRTVVRDTQAPVVAVTDPAPGTVVPGAAITVRGTASDAHLDRVEVGGVRATLSGEIWSLQVTLHEGVNDLVIKAFDKIGNNAAAALSVTRDSKAPAVRIEQPADGASLNVTAVTVSGTVEQEAGLAVTVNGVAATVTGGTFTASGIALSEGRNTLIARVKDALGNQGVYTRVVERDTVAPKLLAADPASGALAVALDGSFRLTFSEDLAPPAAGSWRLETAAGQAIAATGTLSGAVLTVRPTAPLAPTAAIRLVLTAGLKDPAGNALAAPPTLTWTTADTGAPSAPVLAPPPPARLCAASLTLTGTTEAGAQLRVTGGAATAEGRADASGHFSLAVLLTPAGLNRLWVTASDASDNRSAPTIADVITDCQTPRVVSAERQGTAFRVRFSEAVAPASLTGAVTLTAAAGTVAGTLALSADGLTATFTPTVTLPAGALRLEVAARVTDLAGNAMAYPWSQIFGGEGGTGFITGTAIDDATGRPLTGARVIVVASNGTPRTAPFPEQVTGPDGRFRIPIGAGTHDLTVLHPGYTPSFRIVATVAGQGTDVFDPRLTPAAPARSLGADGGSWGSVGNPGDPVLTLPAGALASATAVAVTRLDEQGLPIQLPYGWAPRGAVWLDLGGESLLEQSHLSFPVESPNGTTLTVVRLDLLSLQWRVLGEELVIAGRVDFDLAAGAAEGSYAAVEADSGDTAPPEPVVGAALAGAPHPSGSALTGATLTFDPQVVLPSQTSRATATYQMPSDAHVASGLPLTLSIEEHLELLDNSTRQQAPYEADLVLYHAPGAAQTPRSRFRLKPSAVAQAVPLRLGSENVKLHTYGDESVGGNVIDIQGGTVASPEGDQVNVPYGALPEPTAVTLARKAAADLPLAVPAGTVLAGAVTLDLGGQRLLVPAALSLAMATPPAAGSHGLLLAVVDLPSGKAWRAVAALAATAGGWTTAVIDPEDLAWPGVRDEGLYAFVKPADPFGYFRGTVHNPAAAPLAGALVKGSAAAWLQIIQLTNADGTYALPAPLAASTVTAQDLETGNFGGAAGTVAADQERVDLDLTVQPVSPHVVQFTPADGAVDVPQGIEPAIRFSEPVDPTTLDGAIQLLLGASPVTVDLDAQGALVRVVPRSTLLPGTAYELRVGSGVHDLQGNPNAPAAAHFTTKRVLVPTDVNLAKIFLIEPDAASHARVEGRAGAVPSGTTVSVENLGPFKDFPIPPVVSATADADGSFDLTIPAKLTHTLILHVLIPAGNEVVVKLTPFHTADLRGAYVGSEAASFTTADGVAVDVPEGTFDGPTIVRVTPKTAAEGPIPVPADFAFLYGFDLDFGGAEAHHGLQISVPAPANATAGTYLLNMQVEALGERYWMVHDLMRLDAQTHRLTTEEAAAAVSASTAGAAGLRVVGAGLERRGLQLATAASSSRAKDYLPYAAFPGHYEIIKPLFQMAFVAFPILTPGIVIFNDSVPGVVAKVTPAYNAHLHNSAVLIPTRMGQGYTLAVRDLATGYKLFESYFPPAPDPGLIVLPPDVYGDITPPYPISGSPLRFFPLDLSLGHHEVDRGISLEMSAAGVAITGDPGSIHPGVQVRLFGLDDDVNIAVNGGSDGAFGLSASAVLNKRYILAIGAQISTSDSLEVSFSEALASFDAIELLDAAGRKVPPNVQPVGTMENARVAAKVAWRAGETYTLRLGSLLADGSGNRWNKTLDIQLKVTGSTLLDTYQLDKVRDVARLGSLLFVAADTQGLVVLDASDPKNIKNYLPDDLKFAFPLDDTVQGVAVDPHGRVLVVGGGVKGFGQLKIFDPLSLNLEHIAEYPAFRYTAFRGNTILSDRLGGSSSNLAPGTPRRVAVLSEDRKWEWTFGDDIPPAAGFSIGIDPPPAPGKVFSPGERVKIVVYSPLPGAATPRLPVSLFDLTLGRWQRVDADQEGRFSVSLDVAIGDRLRLLRNVKTFAYVVNRGIGVQVVDVNAFYDELETSSPILSDVIGGYSGYGDPDLELCGNPVFDISSALLDVDGIFDAGDFENPMTVAGLVGFSGLALLRSDPTTPGSMSFLSGACSDVGGDRNVTGMAVLQDYAFDLNRDGRLDPSEERDYILVSHRQYGVLVYDITDRKEIILVGKIKVPGQAANLSVDREGRRLFVAGYLGGLYVVDLNARPSLDPIDGNGDGVDDRILETLTLPASTTAAARFIPELGLAFVGSQNVAGQPGGGVSSVAVGQPRIQALARDLNGRLRAIDRVAPYGTPIPGSPPAPGATPVTPSDADPVLSGSIVIMASLPGVTAGEVKMDLLSVGPSGLPIPEAGDPVALPTLPRTALTGDKAVRLKRSAGRVWEEGYHVYLSDEIAVLADLRASKSYTHSPVEYCPRCPAPESTAELLSGDKIAIHIPDALYARLGQLYGEDRLFARTTELPSVRWEVSPSARQEPVQNASFGLGETVPGTLLSSGEMSHSTVDLQVKGRGFDFAFARTYRSQSVGTGPLGPGWDFSYRERLRELPNGDVERYDGEGRKFVFHIDSAGKLKAPEGIFVSLSKQGIERSTTGWTLVDANKNVKRFDRFGRLVSYADANRDSEDTGNELQFHYDLASRLVRITDSLDRDIRLAYDAQGRLTELEDFSGRKVKYGYDEKGRLAEVTSPAVTVGISAFPAGLTTHYAYSTPAGELTPYLNGRDNLASITDPRGNTWLELTYSDADGDGRADEVTSQHWGAGTVQIAYAFAAPGSEQGTIATVTDRRGNVSVYTHRSSGQVTKVKDPSGAETTLAYNGDGLLESMVSPLGRWTEYRYALADEDNPRSRGNRIEEKVTADSRGPNGSSPSLIRTTEYHPVTNLPRATTEPWGERTEIERDVAGRPLKTTKAAGTVLASETRTTYNKYGQPIEIINPNGHKTTLRYFEAGESKGYLRESEVEPGLVTRYETDARGNVTAIIDPRGVRTEQVWNELDQLVEKREAVTGARSGAPALGYTTYLLYDENGNIVEKHIPAGDSGDEHTVARKTFGPLNEVTAVEREITPGGQVARETYAYDANLNLIEQIGAEGQVSRTTYTSRNLPATVTRGAESDDEVVEELTYDLEGKRTERKDGLGRVWKTAFDGYGRVRRSEDPLGNREEALYDDAGNVKDVLFRDAGGTVLAHKETVYDALNRPSLQKSHLWDAATPVNERILQSRTEYDAAGNVKKAVDPLGHETSFSYDAAERLVTTIDAAGNRSQRTLDENGNEVETHTLEQSATGAVDVLRKSTYDALNRLTETVDGLNHRTQLVLDARGNPRFHIEEGGFSTESRYDGLNRVTSVVKPEGISLTYSYDRSSRLKSLRDAFGHETQYQYDALDRPTLTTYADGTWNRTSYDKAGNPVQLANLRGTVAQQFDSANRLLQRSIAAASGSAMEGPFLETFEYDGLSRIKAVLSGDVSTQRRYDSLSRLVEDRTGVRSVGYRYDDAGNETELLYPSGLDLHSHVDVLNRPDRIGGSTGAATDTDSAVTYGYRGESLVASQTLRNGIAGTFTYDLARRPASRSYTTTQGQDILGESFRWTPRGLMAADSRSDLNGVGLRYEYDGAGRVSSAVRVNDPLAAEGQPGVQRAFASLPRRFDFQYDAAQNLLSRTATEQCQEERVDLPADSSGRNRPASVGGVPLEYDTSGNLVRKGDLHFYYDYLDRLARVTGPAGEVARYKYDSFNRRVEKIAGGHTVTTVWSGWRPIEEYRDGQLSSRRTYGLGLDEIALLELDRDGDGILETKTTPVYDQTGNLAALTRADGSIVERYLYSPFGEMWVLADATPPRVEQVRVKGGAVTMELSEELAADPLAQAITAGTIQLYDVTADAPLTVTVAQPVLTGRQARRRLVITTTGPPAAGHSIRLTFPAAALVDLFGNHGEAPAGGLTWTFPWPANDQVVEDSTAPRVEQACFDDGRLELQLSEEVDLAQIAEVVRVDGAAVTWTPSEDGYSLHAEVGPGAHHLAIGTGPLDFAGNGLETAFSLSFNAGSGEKRTLFSAPDPRLSRSSAAGNPFGFHGLYRDEETGLLYVREFVDTIWDGISLTMGVISLKHNLDEGNFGMAALDVLGIVVDTAAFVTPFVPGGVGAWLQVSREVGALSKLAYLNRAIDVAQGGMQSYLEYTEGNTGWAIFYAGQSALGGAGLWKDRGVVFGGGPAPHLSGPAADVDDDLGPTSGLMAGGTGASAAPSRGGADYKHRANVQKRTAEEVNATYPEWIRDPYQPGRQVLEYTTTRQELFVRVHGEDNKARSWLMRADAVRGLSAEEIKLKYSLLSVPTYISDVTVPVGTKLRTGRVKANFGGNAGAAQYELLEYLDPSFFTNTRALPRKLP